MDNKRRERETQPFEIEIECGDGAGMRLCGFFQMPHMDETCLCLNFAVRSPVMPLLFHMKCQKLNEFLCNRQAFTGYSQKMKLIWEFFPIKKNSSINQ